MSWKNKIIWKEGMFLQPQHFQQAERFTFNSFNSQISLYHPFFFGLTRVEIDRNALENRLFSLVRCAGVLPDGTSISIPNEDIVPSSRSFESYLGHERQSLDVFLCLPLTIDGRSNVTGADKSSNMSCRYRNENVALNDEVFGDSRKEIEVGRYNLQILFEGESLDGYSGLRIARLKRDDRGEIDLDEKFIPPLLNVGSSAYLMNMIKSLLELLGARHDSLCEGRRLIGGGLATFFGTDENSFRMLQILNTFAPLLHYYYRSSSIVHPMDLFSVMTMFSGALSTFSTEFNIDKFPGYDHQNLASTFETLVRMIRTVLEADISAGCVSIPVERMDQATYLCKVKDERLLENAKFFMGVSAKIAEKELIIGTLQRVKMCARERLDLLISSAMPGLPLIHVSRPPEGLPVKPGYVYFSLDHQNQLWKNIQAAGSIAFYFPNSWPELKIELLALKE